MNNINYFHLIILPIILILFGCAEKTASIEGKITDGKTKPLSGVCVILKSNAPDQYYEHFETKTNADGSFQLSGLPPSTDFIITMIAEKWTTKAMPKIKTPEAGKQMDAGLIKIRFQELRNGIMMDTKTGLQWLFYPATDVVKADNVLDIVKNIKTGGKTDWQLPSMKQVGTVQNISSATNQNCCIWVKEPGSKTAEPVPYSEEYHDFWAAKKELSGNRIIVVRNSNPSSSPSSSHEN